LARWQAEWIAVQLGQLAVEVELVRISTQGDVHRFAPVGTIGAQGVFTKEIQRALLEGQIDLAVHSLKDLPTQPIDGLTLAAVPERDSVADVVVSGQAESVQQLRQHARVGTGSLRRRAQLLHVRPDLIIQPVRGNVDTRLRKLDEGQYDAIVLAEAGLKRLGLAQRITQVIPTSLVLPAVGQGALGVETRRDDRATLEILSSLDHPPTRSAVVAERSMLAALRGGCLAPVGAWARTQDDHLRLDGVVLSGDGSQRVAATASGPHEDAARVGKQVAETLLELGAADLISASREVDAWK
jgi:hydroxymethylbilane synthase